MSRFTPLRFGVFCLMLSITAAQFINKARAWQTINIQYLNFPEEPLLREKPKTAVSCAGGGARAFIMCLGQLSGLHELGLLDNVRYLSGVSGGAWAVNGYVYSSEDDDEKLLGPLIQPEDMQLQTLQQGPEQWNGLRYLASGDMQTKALNAWDLGRGLQMHDAWIYGVQDTYLGPSPVNIPDNALVALDEATIEDIKKRNPSLANYSFVTPNPKRPFPIDLFSIVGPAEYRPTLDPQIRRTLLAECTPMYCGTPVDRKLMVYENKTNGGHISVYVGGIIEPYAFSTADTTGQSDTDLAIAETAGIVSRLFDPKIGNHWSFKTSPSASSYVPGGITQSIFGGAFLPFTLNYRSVLPESKEVQMALADGALVQNVNIISFVQRGMDEIIALYNTNTPLNQNWDTSKTPQATDCDIYLPLLFGILPLNPSIVTDIGVDYNNNSHVFDAADFPELMKRLQAAMLPKGTTGGTGAFVRMELTTVKNGKYRILAGKKVHVTFFYNARVPEWESILALKQPSTYSKVVGAKRGTFAGFPMLGTVAGNVPNDVSNALGSMAGWSVVQNRELFEAALGQPKGG